MALKAHRKTAPKKDKSKEIVKKPLARPGDPYVGPDGSILPPEPINRTPAIDLDTKIDARDFRPTARRALKDLPAPSDTINGVACVFMYTLLGIGDREISIALKITLEQVRQVREHSAYAECFELVIGEFINANSDNLQSRLAAYSHGALSQVASIAFLGEKESNKLRASVDLLDRGGFSKKDAAGKSGDGLMNELRIVVVDGEASVSVQMNGNR